MPEELVPREELRATLEARQELGPAYEAELLERFARDLERRLAKTHQGRLTGQQTTGIVIVSILASIPLLGIAGGTVGLAGVIAVCAALVLVNYLVLRR
jgi:hypothetical protein